MEHITQRLDDLETTKGELEVKILQEEMQRPLLTREQVVFWIHRFRKLDVTKPDQRQRLIDSFVNAIYLYEYNICQGIFLNFFLLCSLKICDFAIK